MVPCPNNERSAATLLPLIEQYIAPHTRIISDAWRAYAHIDNIPAMQYQHEVIVHERHFVDPLDPDIHTNTIEGNLTKIFNFLCKTKIYVI